MNHLSLAHYLGSIGILSISEIGSVWKNGVGEFGMELNSLIDLIDQKFYSKKLLSSKTETSHPLWVNRGRRSISRGVSEATDWLWKMNRDQRKFELSQVLNPEKPLSSTLRRSVKKTLRIQPGI